MDNGAIRDTNIDQIYALTGTMMDANGAVLHVMKIGTFVPDVGQLSVIQRVHVVRRVTSFGENQLKYGLKTDDS